MTFKPNLLKGMRGRHIAVENETANYLRCGQCNRLFDRDFGSAAKKYCSERCRMTHSNAKVRERKAKGG